MSVEGLRRKIGFIVFFQKSLFIDKNSSDLERVGEVEESILNTIKQMLGDDLNHNAFDLDIIVNINSSLSVLHQVGLGGTPFQITGELEKWSDLLGERNDIEMVKTYIYLKAKMVFDPPSSSFVLDSMNRMAQEYEWRINVQTGDANGEVTGKTR